MKLTYEHFFLGKMPNQRPQTKLFGAVSPLGVSILYKSASPSHPKTDAGKSCTGHAQGTGESTKNGAPDITESIDNKVNLLFLRLHLLSFKRGRFFLSSGVERSREYCYLYSFEMGHFMIGFQRYLGNTGGE